MNSKFLVKHTATIGRTKEDGGFHPPILLTFYTMVEAADHAAAADLVVQYKDPGFTTQIESIAEVADEISSDDLFGLLKHEDVFREQLG